MLPSVELSVSHKWVSGLGGVGCFCQADPATPTPLTRPAGTLSPEGGEGVNLGRANSYPGRRAEALALGYVLSPFQGGK